MAFLIHSTEDGHIPAWEYLPCSAITPKAGMAMVLNSSGRLTAAAGENTPAYISMTERTAACTAGDIIPVIRVTEDLILRAPFEASPASLKIGDKVMLPSSGGMGLTADKSATSGNDTVYGTAELVQIDTNDGTAYGSALVRF